MSAENPPVEETTTQERTTNSSEIVELEWKEVEQIFALRENLTSIEANFSSMCLNFEKRKMEALSAMKEYENAMYSLAGQLKEEKNIDESLTYELKLPASPEEKAYFIRKEV
tara:strand:+ start:242 stop:577 length:336 start_codon:yes stop_codon:yes gene_type:complete